MLRQPEVPVAGAQLKKGCYERFESGHARGDIDQVLYKRWQAKRVQALRCNKPQRENGTKERYVAQQRALEEDMDRELESARSKRIEEVGLDTNHKVGDILEQQCKDSKKLDAVYNFIASGTLPPRQFGHQRHGGAAPPTSVGATVA